MLATAQAADLVDHHQHLASPQALSVFSFPKAITAADLIAQMNAAGIDRAVVLSDAYGFSNPFKNPGPDEYARIRAENDWVSRQVVSRAFDRLLRREPAARLCTPGDRALL